MIFKPHWQKTIITKVINIRSKEPYDVYIGRRNAAWNLPQSKWANPFKLNKGEPRGSTIDKYRTWLLNNKKLLAGLEELRGKTLACWCRPLACHGLVLIELLHINDEEPLDVT